MKNQLLLSIIILVAGGCQAASGGTAVASEISAPSITETRTAAATSTTGSQATPSPQGEALIPFIVDLSQPFSDIPLTEWTPETYGGMAYSLPLSQSSVSNPHVIDGLTAAERAFLWKNGFVVIHSQEKQFSSLKWSVGGGQPYFLTVDAAYHALHVDFDNILKTLEKEYLRPRMLAVLNSTLSELLAHAGEWKDTPLEAEGTLSVAYISVAVKLFDPEFTADPSVAEIVDQQVQEIMTGGEWKSSVSIPEFIDDYGAYKPVGHYAGDPDLENYFRGMTWLGRIHFLLADKSRVPLIITLALRRAELEGGSAALAWGNIHRILDFIVGPSDDAGPLEYAALMDKVYGDRQTYAGLADDSLWREFLSRGDELPAPQINSLLVLSTKDMESEKGWRFMGQRFTIDAYIFQNLISDRVPDRRLPTGLDVMAVFGSATARSALTEFGLDDYDNYDEQFAMLEKSVQDQPVAQWTNRFYTSWLYSFFPLLGPKGTAFPPFMNTAAWGYKEMNSGLGSWAELKHDTILYTKMPEGAGGGGPPSSGPAPAYVEPDPNSFYRMAYTARSLYAGLMSMDVGVESGGSTDVPLYYLLEAMADLGEQLEGFGNVAVKEIRGEPLEDSDLYGIWGCLGWVECNTSSTGGDSRKPETPPVPVVAAVAGYTDLTTSILLEVGVGFVDRIFVVVPLEGKLQIAQGGVFTYYEFVQPRDNRLTDQEWRDKLLSASPPALPKWAPRFVFMGGTSTLWTVFRLGDVYMVTEEGDQLRVWENPTTSSAVLFRLPVGSYVTIIDGPVQADGYTWWKIEDFDTGRTGWIWEKQEWYVQV